MSGDTTSSDMTWARAARSVDAKADSRIDGHRFACSRFVGSSIACSLIACSPTACRPISRSPLAASRVQANRVQANRDGGGTQVISKHSSHGWFVRAARVGVARARAARVGAARGQLAGGAKSLGGMLVDRFYSVKYGVALPGAGATADQHRRREFERVVRSGECRSPYGGSTPR